MTAGYHSRLNDTTLVIDKRGKTDFIAARAVNFGAKQVPIDRWLGTFHDGSDEATAAFKQRTRERVLGAAPKHPTA